jgi:hypothetical protein
VPKPSDLLNELDNLNAHYDRDVDGGGGEGPEEPFHRKYKDKNPNHPPNPYESGEEIERFGTPGSNDHALFTK